MTANPMQAAFATPRCGAKTRKGTPCQAPAVRGRKRCRMHGGTNPGAPPGPEHPNYKHGLRTRQATLESREARRVLRELAQLLLMAK